MVLGTEQIRQINGDSRENWETDSFSTDLWQRSKGKTMEQRQSFSTNGAGTTKHPHVKKKMNLDRNFEKWSESCSVMSDSLWPHGQYSPWNSLGQNTGVGSLSHLPTRDQTKVSHIAGGSLPAEPREKPKNTGVGSLSLLQRIFLTQELNWGLLHCRQILYQLSYEGSSDRHFTPPTKLTQNGSQI